MNDALRGSWNRRQFLQRGARALGGVALASPLQALLAQRAGAGSATGRARSPYGPPVPTPDLETGLPLLKLPRGFAYRSYGWTGDAMDDGSPTPGNPDGMAVVQTLPNRSRDLVLVRNHELVAGPLLGGGNAPTYDTASVPIVGRLAGGTTTLVFRRGHFASSMASLAGTSVNCAGGPTPWGSWLTCEEGVVDGRSFGGLTHGFVFEVPAPTLGPASAVPIEDMGLFDHEACAVDPRTGFVYETEDNGPRSGFYRYRPDDPSGEVGSLEKGGRLEMLAVVGIDGADLRSVEAGETFPTGWVEIAEPTRFPAQRANAVTFTGPSGPFAQGSAAGAATFRRLEGCWYSRGVVYFVDTSGGAARNGTVWCYRPPKDEPQGVGTLTALFVSPGNPAADNPDNITVSPRGGIVLCEDGGNGPGTNTGLRLLGLTADGCTYELAVNNVLIEKEIPGKQTRPGDYRGSEWAGATFDPTGRYLFVNIQRPGITFVIAGPWRRGDL